MRFFSPKGESLWKGLANLMSDKKRSYSGIGGQAVLEGIMMKNKEKYAIAVRKPDGEITVHMDHYEGVMKDSVLKKIPFVRGVFNFVDSLILGMRCINYSATFYEEEEEPTKFDKALDKISGGNSEKLLSGIVSVISVILAVGIFILLPYYISSILKGFVKNDSLMAVIEGAVRLVIFLLYVLLISLMKDIRRLYMYHGAEHKCINCIEKGRELTVRNVMRCSRQHKRCGTSFLFFVIIVSIVLFFFIRVENPLYKVGLRILLIPVVAGIAYEIIRLAGKSDNIFIRILSAPGMLVQRMTTKEPDEQMVEVAIAAVEAVFDWKTFLKEEFGYDLSDTPVYEEEEELEDRHFAQFHDKNTETEVTEAEEDTEDEA